MSILLILVIIIILFFITRNLFMLFFAMGNYNIHKKRLKQLEFNKKKGKDVAEVIDDVTKPVITHIFSRFKPKNLDQLEIDLKMARWNKYFTPLQYRALSLCLKALGVVMFLLFYRNALPIAIIWGVVLFFGMGVMFRNSKNNVKSKLLSDFPDFIRITEGHLSANMPITQAISECIKYVGAEWKPILQNFVVECDIKSVEEALETLKTEVDLFEVREFVALVKLTLEQGADIRESFRSHADKIREMQMDMIAIKIGRRQMLGIAIQAPLLLCNLLVFGLPTLSAMMNLSAM